MWRHIGDIGTDKLGVIVLSRSLRSMPLFEDLKLKKKRSEREGEREIVIYISRDSIITLVIINRVVHYNIRYYKEWDIL